MKHRKTIFISFVILFLNCSTGLTIAHADETLAKNNNCMTCHGVDNKLVGPAFKDIAAKYKGGSGASGNLVSKVKNGGAGVWGEIPMPPNAAVSDADVKTLVDWILSL
ncbi:MAG: c-type cytochrome [Gammaproteobacteria bacterium]